MPDPRPDFQRLDPLIAQAKAMRAMADAKGSWKCVKDCSVGITFVGNKFNLVSTSYESALEEALAKLGFQVMLDKVVEE